MTSFLLRRPRASRTAALVLTAIGLITPIFSTGVRTQTAGRQIYVAPNGSSTNDGSQTRPLDLATALGGASPARPGDTIWLRGGTYVGNFSSYLTGSLSSPIVVRQYPGERAIIDANTPNRGAPGLAVSGADTWYWGFEVTDSNPERVNTQRGNSIDVYGPRTKFINMIVHDGLQGFGLWTPAIDAEIYGSVIYNVGTEGPDRGHGHSIYTQNQTGIKQITDNIFFNSFSFGIHAYTEGGVIDNFRFEGNVAFNHGVLSASGAKANFLLGGRKVAHDAVFVDNYSYYSPGVGGRGLDIGYVTPCERPTIQGNYVVGGTPLQINCTNAVVNGNTFYGGIPSSLPAAYPSNTYLTTRPTGVVVDVRPNRYEAGRGHVVIYNWAGLASVNVDLSTLGLHAGDGFEVRDAQNFFGPAVVAGSYSGAPVDIRMTGLTAAAPVGNAPRRPTHTAPEFGVFVVLRTGQSPPPVPPPPPSGGPASATFVRTDTATQGNWRGVYGTEGYSLAPDVTALPGFAQVTMTGNLPWVWSSETTDVRGLQRPTGTGRFAGTWYNQLSSMVIDVPITDGQSHRVAFYVVDWDTANTRVMAIDVLDANTNAVLDQRSVATFRGGQYLVWQVSGRVRFRLTKTVWDAVLSGIFIDAAGGSSGNSPPPVPPPPVPPPPVPPPPGGGGTLATFVRTDTTTQGNWRGAYGTDGYSLAPDLKALPSYAQVTMKGNLGWVWSPDTTDVRGLQRPTGTGRFAATWYNQSSFTVDVAIADGQSHRIAFYVVDWDTPSRRVQAIEVLDANTNAVLDQRSVASFRGGQYLVWQVSGRVRFRLTKTAWDAVVSGVFFDR